VIRSHAATRSTGTARLPISVTMAASQTGTRSRPRLALRLPRRDLFLLAPLTVANLVIASATPREVVLACLAATLIALAPWYSLYADAAWYPDLRGWRRELDVLFVIAAYSPTAVSSFTGGAIAAIVLAAVAGTGAAIARLEQIRRSWGPPADPSPPIEALERGARRRRRTIQRSARRWRNAVRRVGD
jgi:hypothetical protein